MLLTNNHIKYLGAALLLITIITSYGCKDPGRAKEKHLISFRAFNGINYSEVARRQKNGLSFNEYGYQLEPQWKMKFVSDDSVSIFSPTKNTFINFPLTRGYDSVFNAARSWLKIKKMSKDSIVMEILQAKGDSIDINGSKVYMLFYADNYVKNVLHTDTSILRRPSRKDTLFVKGLAAKANSNITKAFSARQPVQLISKSALVSVKQKVTKPDITNNFDSSDDYLDPNFDIIINKAYKDFYYSFEVCVDDKGQMHYVKPLIDFSMSEDFKDTYVRLSQGIMSSYLQYYFKVVPGSTLGFAHASTISVHVEGRTGAK
ncbi:hypothetical protein SAMN05421821_102507 [Mucilaginibacter lappiensis]|uniref:Uncharacterized protein n=1 Tax=Mucilaginibacter lappiensis TaxID=354630 RepID=A0ABR6PJ44_9SPHI|nr:hypothetical protein [Mucilaginibacter lappiensis]MBB6108256.1 hypothetical protein [Mucilaginibacter lappiensis]SIQ45310.1 hypothetical protein SAMN05421821_102507 [Mucilaginibacter lappiensis]